MNEQVIMIVEDEPDIREGIRILLKGEGYLVLEASTESTKVIFQN